MYYWWERTWSSVQKIGEPWNVFFEPRAHFSCCTCHIDGRFATPEVTRGIHLTLQNLDTLTTLHWIIEKVLHVFDNQSVNLQKCTWKGDNNSRKGKISSEDVLRWSTDWILLEKPLDMEILHQFSLHRFSQFWLRYMGIQKHTCGWRRGEEQVYVSYFNT